MLIETIEVCGFKGAMRGFRNPLNSWAKGDTYFIENIENKKDYTVHIGPKDKELSCKLQNAGPEHCKHLRMIMVWADITGERSWWTQFDTYRIGVEKISTSTMHKMMSRELTPDDFESCNGGCYSETLLHTIEYINELIREYNKETDIDIKRKLWEYVIQILPQSYLQKRTVMISYAALRNIVKQREGHKLKDWQVFIEWAHTLPESWMIFE